MDFVDWQSVKLAYKPIRFKSLLSDIVVNNRKSLQPEKHQDIHNFWLNDSINPNDSRATSSIFQNTSFCNSINLSQIKISWKKKNLSKMEQRNFIHWNKDIQ